MPGRPICAGRSRPAGGRAWCWAGRDHPPLRVARLRTQGQIHQRTEGWAAGLYLAALHLREGGSLRDAENAFGGDDRLVSQYLESVIRSRRLELLDA
jgi:hypothetical protein